MTPEELTILSSRLIEQRLSADYIAWVKQRRAEGLCVLQSYLGEPHRGWCLTHNVADNADHHFMVHPEAYND